VECLAALDFFLWVAAFSGPPEGEVHHAVLEKATFGDCVVRLRLFAETAMALLTVGFPFLSWSCCVSSGTAAAAGGERFPVGQLRE